MGWLAATIPLPLIETMKTTATMKIEKNLILPTRLQLHLKKYRK
jgi:hypothetical protein